MIPLGRMEFPLPLEGFTKTQLLWKEKQFVLPICFWI